LNVSSQPPNPPSTSQCSLILQIDWEHLHQLSDSDPEFEVQLLGLFVEDTDVHLISLKHAIAHQQFDEIEKLAHYIKGASANVGVHGIYTSAEQLEVYAQHHQPDGLDRCYEAIAAHTHQLQTWVRGQQRPHPVDGYEDAQSP
jgi:HPt (histidine-containing phosphotransfer) domain-containing protein